MTFPKCILLIVLVCLITVNPDDLYEQNNAFSVKYFNKISSQSRNLISSPFSLEVIISLLLLGARADTARSIRRTLGYSNSTHVNSGYADIIPKLQSSADYQLNLANSIWVQDGFPIKSDYRKSLKDIFQSEAHTFADPNSAVGRINSWVSNHTNNKIPQLLEKLEHPTVMVLVNAIYFQGNWIYQFDEHETKLENFNTGNSQISVNFMTQKRKFPYRESAQLNSKILHLPYKGNQLVLVIVLPNTVTTDLNNVTANANFQTEALNDLSRAKVNIKIPKFKIETTLNMEKALQDLGMEKAFTDEADFSGISEKVGIRVSKVIQKAMIEVNEKGSEAAAATAITVMRAINVADFEETKTFFADHPFIFLIYHKLTRTILFIGKYVGA